MVDVVVDQKPKELLPYDPNDIPDAVKQRVRDVEKFYADAAAQSASEAPQASAQAAVSSPTAAPPASAPVPDRLPPEDENADSWKHRYLAMQGRYTSATKTIGEMQGQMEQLGSELMHMQRSAPAPRRQQPANNYITNQDVENYGPELVDLTQRAAMQVMVPELQEVKQQNAELQRRLAIEARRRLDQAVEIGVPNYRDVDRDPRWHRWLLGIDTLSGRVRQQLLNEAISAAAAPRVISFFKGFLQEEAATGHIEPAPTQQPAAPREAAIPLASLAAPGRARPATGGDASFPPDKPIYTRAQVKTLYEQHRKGAYVGREADWARIEADMFAAQREGRFR
jgi:hypothetical protein